MSELIGSDKPLAADAEATLQALVGAMIPASAAHNVPGADDPEIFADLLRSAASFLEFIAEGMRALDDSTANGRYLDLGSAERLTTAEQFRLAQPEAMGLLISLACQCYYRDPRVMASLDMPPRPPFPEGFEVADGDWSLLDPVRARGIVYREIP